MDKEEDTSLIMNVMLSVAVRLNFRILFRKIYFQIIFLADLLKNNIDPDIKCALKIYNRHGFPAWMGWKAHCKGKRLPSVDECYKAEDEVYGIESEEINEVNEYEEIDGVGESEEIDNDIESEEISDTNESDEINDIGYESWYQNYFQ